MSDNQPSSSLSIEAESEEILALYRDHPERTLKTLVCRAYGYSSKEYVALVMRGDQHANFEAVKRILTLKSVRLANREEMQKLGLCVGYVSPIDCSSMKIFVDPAVQAFDSYFDGANKDRTYRKNVNFPRDFGATAVEAITE